MMSRKSSDRVNELSSDIIYGSPAAILIKHKHHRTYNNNNINDSPGNYWTVSRHVQDNNKNRQVYNSRTLRFLRRIGDKTLRVLRFLGRSSGKSKVVSSYNSPTGNNNLMRSRSLVDQSESHRAQAIEDCIEFLHSYSSLQRCSSVSSSCN